MATNNNYILTKEAAAHKLERLALEVAEQLHGDDAELVIIGIRKSGTVIAEKVGALIKQHLSNPVIIIEASLDKSMPGEVTLSQPIDFNQKSILIADDVTNSGKTLLYVLKPLLSFYPKRIQTLVLVERMHKLFPIKADYVGLSVATTLQENIVVEIDNNEVAGAYVS